MLNKINASKIKGYSFGENKKSYSWEAVMEVDFIYF